MPMQPMSALQPTNPPKKTQKAKKTPKALCLLLAACLLLPWGATLAQAQDLSGDPTYQYMVRRVEMAHALGRYYTWPLEKKAELDAYKSSLGLLGPSDPLHALPTQGDLPQEQALSLAYDAIEERFGSGRSILEPFHVEYNFITSQDRSLAPSWTLLIQDAQGIQEYPPAFWVEIASPSGQVLACEERTSLLVEPGLEQPQPGPGELSREQAVQVAFDYALVHYDPSVGMTAEILQSFLPSVILQGDVEGSRSYFIEFNPRDDELFTYFGPYSVTLDAQDGTVLGGGRGNG